MQTGKVANKKFIIIIQIINQR